MTQRDKTVGAVVLALLALWLYTVDLPSLNVKVVEVDFTPAERKRKAG